MPRYDASIRWFNDGTTDTSFDHLAHRLSPVASSTASTQCSIHTWQTEKVKAMQNHIQNIPSHRRAKEVILTHLFQSKSLSTCLWRKPYQQESQPSAEFMFGSCFFPSLKRHFDTPNDKWKSFGGSLVFKETPTIKRCLLEGNMLGCKVHHFKCMTYYKLWLTMAPKEKSWTNFGLRNRSY